MYSKDNGKEFNSTDKKVVFCALHDKGNRKVGSSFSYSCGVEYFIKDKVVTLI